jgi:hypothetical protein
MGSPPSGCAETLIVLPRGRRTYPRSALRLTWPPFACR